MKASFNMAKNTEKDCLNVRAVVLSTMATGSTVKCTDRELILSRVDKYTLDNG